MEALRKYLTDTGMKPGEFAKLLGIKPPHMSLLRSGKRKPSRELSVRIATATGGAVPVSCWDEE